MTLILILVSFENKYNGTNLRHTAASLTNITNNSNSINDIPINNTSSLSNIRSLITVEALAEDRNGLLPTNNSELSLIYSQFQNSTNADNTNNSNLTDFNKDPYLFPFGMVSIHFANRILLYLDNERNQRLRIMPNLHMSTTLSALQQITLRRKIMKLRQDL